MEMNSDRIEEILEPGSEQQQSSREQRVRAQFWSTLRKAAKVMPMGEEVTAAYYCALDKETPSKVRGTLLAALAYFILPLDLLPDFILGLGFTDDLAVIMAAIGAVRSNITDAHRTAARQALSEEGDET